MTTNQQIRLDNTLAFIRTFIARNGYPPTMREIAAGLGLASPCAVSNRLHQLEASGAIKLTPRTIRGIEVLG